MFSFTVFSSDGMITFIKKLLVSFKLSVNTKQGFEDDEKWIKGSTEFR